SCFGQVRSRPCCEIEKKKPTLAGGPSWLRLQLWQRAREVDTALDAGTGNNGIGHQFASRPNHAQSAIRQKIAAHIISRRLAVWRRYRMRVIERNQLRFLPGIEDRAINLPGLRLITAVVDSDAEF